MAVTIFSPPNGMSSYFWFIDHWVKFRLSIGNYQNIITFLEYHDLSFLSEMAINFDQIPLPLHGKGTSRNLLEYLSNNSDDNALILNFLNYFIVVILKLKYSSGRPIYFNFLENTDWTNITLLIPSSNGPITTTTTSTTLAPTTTTTTTAELTTTTTTAELTTTTTTAELTTTTTTAELTTTTTTAELTTTTTTAELTTTTTTTVMLLTPPKILILGDATNAGNVATAISNDLISLGYSTPQVDSVQLGLSYEATGLTTSDYDAVLLYTAGSQIGGANLYSNIYNYVYSGGSLVTGVYLWDQTPASFDYTLTPFVGPGSLNVDTTGDMTTLIVHPITTGLNTGITNTSTTYTDGALSLQVGATQIATFTSGGDPYVAVNTIGSAKLVGINTYLGNFNHTNLVRLMTNSLLWSTNKI